MSLLIENYEPYVMEDGLNTAKAVNFSSAPSVALPSGTTIGGSPVSGLGVITSSSANALTVGPNGATNPSFNVDASTASAATGVNFKSAAAAAGIALSAISSGTDENMTIDAKGAGIITLNGTATGATKIGHGFGGSTQALSGAGAVNLTSLTTKVTSTGANALTLADGFDGQMKIIVMVVDGGDATLTPTTKTGFTTITFNDIGDGVTLVFTTTTGWICVGNNGATLA